jgi:hypothetical protein
LIFKVGCAMDHRLVSCGLSNVSDLVLETQSCGLAGLPSAVCLQSSSGSQQ